MVLGLLPWLAAGCSRPVLEAQGPVLLKTDRYKAYFETSVQVLRDNGFVIDRRDYRFGRITTRPLGSPTVLEPWHAQNTTADQAWASTFNDQRRVVTVRFAPASETGGPESLSDTLAFEVEVEVQRKQIPTRRMAGSATRNVFSSLSAPPRELADKGVSGAYWEPIGRDTYLEARLMRQIQERVQGEDTVGHR